MSKQRELLPTVVRELARFDPNVGVAVLGSVSRGYERPESDIDLVAVFGNRAPLAPGTSWRAGPVYAGNPKFSKRIDGIQVDVLFASKAGLLGWIREAPHHMYPFSRSEILRDLRGRAAKCRQAARRCFKKRPDLAAVWEEQLSCHKWAKVAGKDEHGRIRLPDGRLMAYEGLVDFITRLNALASEAGGWTSR